MSAARIAFACAAAVGGQQAPPTPPGTDIYLARLTPAGIEQPINITNRPGYDNQPSFTPDGKGILYTRSDGTQTDIYFYDFTTRSSEPTAVTSTPESEYSPTVTPDGQGISVIRVEAGAPASLAPDARQRLWRFDRGGQNATLVLRDVKPVGYHAWGPDGLLALYVLGKPNTLQVADSRTGRSRIVAQGIGRSIHRIPGRNTVSVLHIEANNRTIKELDLKKGALTPIVRAVDSPDGDYTWTPAGAVLMSNGKELMRWSDGEWTRIADLAAIGLAGASRLAVSPDGRWLALVVPDPAH